MNIKNQALKFMNQMNMQGSRELNKAQ